MILLIDNYDSFTYNLYQYIGEFDENIKVVRNDEITSKEILELKPDKLVISPGPKTPNEAGNCLDIIEKVSPIIPTLGICLGHQSIGQAFGGNVIHAKELYHGKSSIIRVSNSPLFKGIEGDLTIARYHSLVVELESLPDCFEVLATTDEDELMALKHKEYDIYGLQFHPESILTPEGKKIIENFVNM